MGPKLQGLAKPPTPPSTSHSQQTSTAPPPPPSSAAISGQERVTVDKQTDFSVLWKWMIPKFETIKSKAVYSPYFEVVGGLNCRVQVYPRGDSAALPGSLSLYAQFTGPRGTKFDRFTYFKLSILNHLDESMSLNKESFFRFTGKKELYGWSDFTLSSKVLDPKLGFILNNSLTVTADIRILNESTTFLPGVSSGKFTWTIKNFGLFMEMIKTHKLLSPSFPAEDCNLRIRVSRSVVDKVEYLSLCLESEETEKSIILEYRSCWCMFKISVLKQKSGSKSIHRDLHGRFATHNNFGDSTYIGWCDYMKFSRFIRSDNGFLVDDTAIFSVSFQAIKESSGYLKITSSLGARNSILSNKPDGYQGGYVWKIKNFARLKDILKKRKIMGLAIKSRRFQIGNQEFRLVVYPRGQSQPSCYLSFYLEVVKQQNTSSDWSCFVSYRLSVTNQRTLDKSVSRDSLDRLSHTEELGWPDFMTLNSLLDQDSGFLVGDTLNFCAEVLLLKEIFLKGNDEVKNSGVPLDFLGEGECFLWIMNNFLSFKDILETKKIVSQTFQACGCELQIGVCKSLDTICASLESDTSVIGDSEMKLWVCRLALVKQKDFLKSVWKAYAICSKSRNSSFKRFMKVSDMLDPDAGFFYNESVVFFCQILDHCPWSMISEPEGLASHDSQNAFSNDLDELTDSKCSELSNENMDDIFESILKREGFDAATVRQYCCSLSSNVEWIQHTRNKFCIYLDDRKAKDFGSAVKNLFIHRVDGDAEASSFVMNFWAVIKVAQQVIIDLLLDIMVECCQHSETRSSVDCYNTSSEPSTQKNGAFSQAEFLRQNKPEGSGPSPKFETLASRVDGSSSTCAVEYLEEKRTDIPKKAVLAQPPLEASAMALLKMNYGQDLKIKCLEQPEELLGMIINSLKTLDVSVPQGFSKPKRWPASVQKISHVLDEVPKHLQLDLVTLVPKLVDHSEHPLAASALIRQLTKPDADPELQIPVFAAISQLDFNIEVWESMFFRTSQLVIELNDGALACTIGFLFMAASHCQHLSEAVRVVRVWLCRLGVEVSPCVLNFLSETVISCSDIAKALLRDIESSFELDDKYLASSGGPFLHGEDEHITTGLNMMDDQLLPENHHFSDVFILIEMLSVPSLTNEASQAFEGAVARGSIVVHLVAMVLERCRALRPNIGQVSSAGKNQQRDEAADEKIESSPVEEDDIASVLGLVERFSLSRDFRVQQFVRMLYATLFRLFADESYYKRMLKGLVDRAVSQVENGHHADTDFNTLLFLVNVEHRLAEPVLNMMREVTKVANVDRETLRHQLHVSEDRNLHTKEEKRAEHAELASEKASLLERLTESEAATNHYKSELKVEIGCFAREKKDLSKRIQEVESLLEWFQSEHNDEITKLSTEKKMYKDRLHNLETQLSQLNSQNKEDLQRLVIEKNALSERLKNAESERKRSYEELECYARQIQSLGDVRHSLQDEVMQFKVTVQQFEREELDKKENIKQLEAYIGEMKVNFSACQSELKLEIDRFAREKKDLSEKIQEVESQREWSRSEHNDEITKLSTEKKMYKDLFHNLERQLSQLKSQNTDDLKRLEKEKNALSECLKSAESTRNKADRELKCYAREIQTQEDVRHSLQDEVKQLKVTVGQLEQEKLDKEEHIEQLEAYIGQMEVNFIACEKKIHSLQVDLREEMTQHAPLYGEGLEDLSMKELETLLGIHQEGLERIHALQQKEGSLVANPPANPNIFPNSSRSNSIAPSPIPVGQPASVSLPGTLVPYSGRVTHQELPWHDQT